MGVEDSFLNEVHGTNRKPQMNEKWVFFYLLNLVVERGEM